MAELPKSKQIHFLNLPIWVRECAKSEAKVITKGNVDVYFSKLIETLFIAQRPKNGKILNLKQQSKGINE